MVSAVLVIGALGGTGWYIKSVGSQFATDEATGCLKESTAPVAALFLVDATDKLSAENAARIKTHIEDVVNELPRYSKVIVVPFGGDQAVPLQPVFDQCVPGQAGDERLDEGAMLLQQRFDQFAEVLSELATQLTEVPDAPASPITHQVVRAVSDDVLHWEGEVRRLILVTDGLQSRMYRTDAGALPPPPSKNFLWDVDVEFFEVGNPRDVARQNRMMREQWQMWFETAGAKVKMTSPGY
jgi:hypothetical protein